MIPKVEQVCISLLIAKANIGTELWIKKKKLRAKLIKSITCKLYDSIIILIPHNPSRIDIPEHVYS